MTPKQEQRAALLARLERCDAYRRGSLEWLPLHRFGAMNAFRDPWHTAIETGTASQPVTPCWHAVLAAQPPADDGPPTRTSHLYFITLDELEDAIRLYLVGDAESRLLSGRDEPW